MHVLRQYVYILYVVPGVFGLLLQFLYIRFVVEPSSAVASLGCMVVVPCWPWIAAFSPWCVWPG